MKSSPKAAPPLGIRPKWTSLESVLRAPELYALCDKLGFLPPIWHKTDEFIERIEGSVDENSLERERSYIRGDGDRGDGVLVLTDPVAFGRVVEEAEEFFTRRARISQNTHELDCVIQLLIKIREQLVSQKPIQTATILDLTGAMWCGRNWQNLPEPLNERRTALDGVLREIGLARERPTIGVVDSRSYTLAKAAQGYVANDWMHTRWMARILATDMLLNLQSALKDREKQLTRWWRNPYALVVGGLLLAYVAMPFGIALCIAGVLGYVAQFRNLSTQSELERIITEVQSDFYSGRVLADRLEGLNRSRCDVPSILTEVLRSGPGSGDGRHPE